MAAPDVPGFTGGDDNNNFFAPQWAADAWQGGEARRDDLPGPATETLLDLTGIGPGSPVLGVAAWTGAQTLGAARRVELIGEVLATNVAALMLDRAAEAADQAGLSWVATRVMDAHDLTRNADGFDAAICRQDLLLYLADLGRALAGLRRVLRPMNVTIARQIHAGVVMDTRDMTFDPAETVRRYPAITATPLADVVAHDYVRQRGKADATCSGPAPPPETWTSYDNELALLVGGPR